MKKNIVIIVISVVVFLLALLFFIFSLNTTPNNNEIKQENIIQEDENTQTEDIKNVSYKDFTIYKEDRSEVKLSEFKDKPIMILFFNQDNEDSMKMLDKVEKIYKNFDDKVKFLMVNTSQEVDTSLKDKYSIEIFYDFYKEAVRNYNVMELPAMICINKENEVFNAKNGTVSDDALDANLNILIENY